MDALTPLNESIGEVANVWASKSIFAVYRSKLSEKTAIRHRCDLLHLKQFLATLNVVSGDLYEEPNAWAVMTWGLLTAYQNWMLKNGYTIGTVNVRLSTAKTYAQLAFKAGAISGEVYALMRTVKNLRYAEGLNIDSKRTKSRVSTEKNTPTLINPEQIRALKNQPNTPIGLRDCVMMFLLLDYGLRCSELADLKVSNINLHTGILNFYRRKVKKRQSHRLSPDALYALNRYLKSRKIEADSLLLSADAGGHLKPVGIGTRNINQRVKALGLIVGLKSLSPHDCRHSWATRVARSGTPLKAFQDAGGWSSPSMPLRYAASSEIANDGVKLAD